MLAARAREPGSDSELDGYKDATTIEKLAYQTAEVDAAGNPVKDASGNPVTETATTQTQTLPMGRWPRRNPSRNWAPTAADSSTRIRPIRTRIRRRLTNLLEMLAILLIPFALTYTFGKMVGDTRQGWALLAAMLVLLGAA